MLKRLVPKSVKKHVRELHRKHVFEKALNEFAANGNRPPSELLLENLIYGWGNIGFSAETEYLSSVLQYAFDARGPILECGSGLSTLLLGLVGRETGNEVWTLEHHPEWAERVLSAAAKFGLNSIELCVAPLREYGTFSWYDAPLEKMPSNFQIVVCDGPPGDTRGGRYGMLPVMRHFLAPNCTILLDDAARSDEDATARKWAEELGTTLEFVGKKKPFAVLVVP